MDCPISVFGGLQDSSVTEEGLSARQEQTTNSFDLRMSSGDHFFMQSSRTALLQDLTQKLSLFLHSQERHF